MQKLVAIWNGVRGAWERPETENLLCGHSELYSVTWPTSGTMRNGKVLELPKRVPLTKDSESLSLRGELFGTVTTATSGRSSNFRKGSNPNPVEFVEEILELMRTPTASEAERGHQPEEKAKARGGQVTLSGQFMNLPTPMTSDIYSDRMKSSQTKEGSMHSVTLAQAVHMTWGRFEPAVKRWEVISGHQAPEPTEPTGKDGAPRLSSKFTEWMMGLEPGWITNQGLSRKDELKACGNGVVPQQAELALKMLLERKNNE